MKNRIYFAEHPHFGMHEVCMIVSFRFSYSHLLILNVVLFHIKITSTVMYTNRECRHNQIRNSDICTDFSKYAYDGHRALRSAARSLLYTGSKQCLFHHRLWAW